MSSSSVWTPQSYLFVPGNRSERFPGALSSGADAVIVDLEDAVEPAAKDVARENVAAWASRSRPVLVRINGRGTPWFEHDAMIGALDGIAGIVVPKAEGPDDIVEVVRRARRRIPIFPLIETARGMWSALEIAKAPCVARLMFGTLDFIADMGTDDPGAALNPYRTQLALVSRVAEIESPVDGVTADIHDTDRLSADTRNGKQHGFGAKLCIHPKQIAAVHACYGPGDHELDWAARVMDAVSRENGAVITIDGKMIDRPVVLRAQRLLALGSYRQQSCPE
ncbi:MULTISPECIES: HpcH/HpaI aldolase/citrate lyase family protein [Burkholderia]|uniref:HpcH/HpaI aldolase/citrate lyase family protein n=1 Tax=Burkholderia TaxID=32008 RepID=UPI0010441A17|nr:CoA ester lyase [Burkholderia pyrrocinia]EKS9883418.1 CoA ester lyase [Burkholderia pyrrocinia]EKS9893114.1 CoA ester lyase [Burkholderia pyrrocinia]EKS9908888.1 CoA ester lyase [Burkholderia pyrrocinia]TDA48456.1 CoA ester lyase [Burkholderia pyrrocinia]